MTTLRPFSRILPVLLVAASLSATSRPASALDPRTGSAAAAADSSPVTPSGSHSDTLRFRPISEFFDSTGHEPAFEDHTVHMGPWSDSEWLRAPMGDHLLDHPDTWSSEHRNRSQNTDLVIDYNRVDLVRYGLHYQAQRPATMLPRIGARLEYATGRKTTMYGVQMEQPLQKTARFVVGVSMVRRTEHPELQLVEDLENSLALLFTRTDYRDYYEREVRPLLIPVGLDPAHPFPQVANKSLNFIARLGGKDAFGRRNTISIVKVPRVLPRLMKLPGDGGEQAFVLLTSVIRAHLG